MAISISIRILPWARAAQAATLIRQTVFVIEQGVPPEIEIDDWDDRCDHALAYDERGRAIGTGRLLPDGHIGRLAVLSEARGQGVGSALLVALVDHARALGFARVYLNAQSHAAPFYQRHGFETVGQEFMEAGIPHIAMARDI